MFEWYVVRSGSKNGYQKRHFLKGDWIKCSKYDNHSRLSSEHNWEDLYDHSMHMRIFTSIMIKIFI